MDWSSLYPPEASSKGWSRSMLYMPLLLPSQPQLTWTMPVGAS